MPEVATPNQGEREFETGSDEFAKAQSELNQAGSAVQNLLTFLNHKRTYDLYQDLDVERARKLDNISTQALQNAVENANLAAKSYLEHNNLAHDSYWNPVSAGAGMNLTAGATPANRAADVAAAGQAGNAEAIGAAVAKSVDATITPVLATLQQIIQALTTATATIANVVNQAQPKVT